ncbi:MAG: response regulator [Nitrospinae bacterium]|nr:response regulator [Nitrospinota bacterium]
MKIRNKLIINALIAIVSILTMGITGYFFTSNVANVSLRLFETEALPIIKINQIEKTLQGELLRLIGHVSAEDPDRMDQLKAEIEALHIQLDKEVKDYQETINDVNHKEDTHSIQGFLDKRVEFVKTGYEVISLSSGYAKSDALRLVLGKGKQIYNEALASLQATIGEHQDNMSTLRDEAVTTRSRSATTLLVILLFSVGGALISGWFLTRLILPIRSLQESADQLTKGNLDEEIDTGRKDELGNLARSFVKMRNAIRDKIDEIELMNKNLESIVNERTQDLEQKALELTEKNIELKRSQEQLLTSEKIAAEARDQAIDANKSKSEFLSMMSHEIRTPMNAIIGMTHLALQTELTSKQHDFLNKVQSSAQSLLGIINDILDFSKIEAGKMDIETVDFNLEDILDNLSILITHKAEEKGLEVHFATTSDVPTLLKGDPLRIGQILLNLTNNAIKFTENGEIVIEINKVSISEKTREVVLQFTVKDTGIGLSQEQIGRLFKSFSQADISTTRKYGGTGLGLTICKRLVELMGGEIWVESKLHEGSSFIFTLSLGLQGERRKHKLLPPESLEGLKILVVDDNKTSRTILQNLLQSFSFNATIASSGKEAIELLESSPKDDPYKLVLMDWKMPEMDGIEATNCIRKNPNITSIPTIIMVTAYGREEVVRKAEEANLDGFLIKPVNSSVMFDTIMETFGQKRFTRRKPTSKLSKRNDELEKIKGAKILLVEDNLINQEVATGILSNAGFEITIANNGREAVETVGKDNFDVVLMDIQMPEMDGYEATTIIRQNKQFKDLPVIAMTAHAMASEKEKCLSIGMNDHATKPIDPEKLFSTLIKWIKPSERTTPVSKKEEVHTSTPLKEDELPEHIPGIDISVALRNLGNNKELLKKVVIMFATEYDRWEEEIRDSLQRKDFKTAMLQAHTLKGVSGNIASMELYKATTALDEALKKEKYDDCPALLEDCIPHLHLTLQSSRELKNNIAKKETVPQNEREGFDKEKVEPLLLQLYSLIKENSFDVEDCFQEIAELLKLNHLKSEMEELEGYLNNLDFDNAMPSLIKIGQALKIDFKEG